MADKTPKYGSTPLDSDDDSVLYKELSTGVYALSVGASAMVGSNLVSNANPMPVTKISETQTVITAIHTAKLVNGNTRLVNANPNRKYLLIVNDSDTTIYINLGGDAAVHTGIRINANGGSYEMSTTTGNLFLGSINANHNAVVDKRVLITGGV